jgi:hypothetical protein
MKKKKHFGDEGINWEKSKRMLQKLGREGCWTGSIYALQKNVCYEDDDDGNNVC